MRGTPTCDIFKSVMKLQLWTAFAVLSCLPALAQAEEEAQPYVRPRISTVVTMDEFRPLTGKERWQLYWRESYFTPGAFFRNVMPALGAQRRDEPPQWGQGMEGFSKRLANRVARSTIRESITAGGSAALGYDVRYVKCQCKGFFPRFGHALAWNFITLNRNGNKVFDAPVIAGAFGSEFIGLTWMPKGYRSPGDAAISASTQLAFGALFNSINEFMPRKWRRTYPSDPAAGPARTK